MSRIQRHSLQSPSLSYSSSTTHVGQGVSHTKASCLPLTLQSASNLDVLRRGRRASKHTVRLFSIDALTASKPQQTSYQRPAHWVEQRCTGLLVSLQRCASNLSTPSPAMQTPVSLLTPIGYSRNSCGYCKSSGSFSYYARTTYLHPGVYQSLLDRGWRRSGSLLYKPDQSAACCPHYTIRLDADDFHASKNQRQSLNHFNKYAIGEGYIKEATRLYPKSRDQAKKRNTDFDLLERVHESEKSNLKTPPEPAHSLKVTLEPDNYTEEKYVLFENYQRIIHHEPPNRISKSGFRNFLCRSPIPRTKATIDGRERNLGSYHQCYRIDGKLVAVGVLDLLPQCVSAVYFMYHESVHQHGFGKLGALREIAMAKEEGYKWWYAGFYIQSCVKMRYKGDYTPQYMLDPDSYTWDLLTNDLKRKLDDRKFVSLSRERVEGPAHSQNEAPPEIQSTEEPMDIAEEISTSEMVEDECSDDDLPDPNSNVQLWDRSMPGILNKNQLLTEIDLDEVKLQVDGKVFEAHRLVAWDNSNIDDPHSIKGIIAGLLAAVGPEVSKEMIMYF